MNYYRLDIEVAFVVISLVMHFISWGGGGWGGLFKVAIDQ